MMYYIEYDEEVIVYYHWISGVIFDEKDISNIPPDSLFYQYDYFTIIPTDSFYVQNVNALVIRDPILKNSTYAIRILGKLYKLMRENTLNELLSE